MMREAETGVVVTSPEPPAAPEAGSRKPQGGPSPTAPGARPCSHLDSGSLASRAETEDVCPLKLHNSW